LTASQLRPIDLEFQSPLATVRTLARR
jgi:hypothetical protein